MPQFYSHLLSESMALYLALEFVEPLWGLFSKASERVSSLHLASAGIVIVYCFIIDQQLTLAPLQL